MDNRNNTIGQFVKEKRKSLKMTQVELSFKAGIGVRFVRELEQGKKTLKMNKVNQVLELFGYTLKPVSINDNTNIDETG